MRVVTLLWMTVCLIGMAAVWVIWDPQGESQVFGWWIAEVVLGSLILQALAAFILAGK
jgi:hypothetical protein